MTLWFIAAAILALFTLMLMLPAGVEIVLQRNRWRMWVLLSGIRVRLRKRTNQRKKAARLPRARNVRSQASWPEFDWEDAKIVARTGRRLIRCFRFRVRDGHIVVASPDPSMTGIAYGWLCAGRAISGDRWPAQIDVDFTREHPAFSGHVRLSAVPARVLGVLIGGVFRLLIRKRGRVARLLHLSKN